MLGYGSSVTFHLQSGDHEESAACDRTREIVDVVVAIPSIQKQLKEKDASRLPVTRSISVGKVGLLQRGYRSHVMLLLSAAEKTGLLDSFSPCSFMTFPHEYQPDNETAPS